ncbi:MAG: UDP-3-O-acyl-N-acetylglucosamine deacetylase [Alistipes onderdonkii]
MSTKQQTLKAPISFSGKGLHTGVKVTMTVNPAEVDTGIVFRRTDLEGQPIIPALCDYVVDTSRGTTIESGGHRVSTIEHIMSALWTLGVDNAVIDIDAPETPIMDGSACAYAKAITETASPTSRRAQFYHVTERWSTIPSMAWRSSSTPTTNSPSRCRLQLAGSATNTPPGDNFAERVRPAARSSSCTSWNTDEDDPHQGRRSGQRHRRGREPVPDEQLHQEDLQQARHRDQRRLPEQPRTALQQRTGVPQAARPAGRFALLGAASGRVCNPPRHYANTEFMKQLKHTIRKAGENPATSTTAASAPLRHQRHSPPAPTARHPARTAFSTATPPTVSL